jgi:RNA polymerase primary sigma factor
MTSARSAQRSGDARMRVTRAMVDELRVIVDRSGAQQAKSLVTEFAARHHLTHRDVDALLTCLAQDAVSEAPSTFAVAPTAVANPTAGDPIATVLVPIGATWASAQPDGAAEKAETDTPADDLAWMFGEQLGSPAPRAADDVMGRALDDLLGDWSRTGGQLGRADVSLLVTKRKLSLSQHGELLDMIEAAGIDLPDPTDLRPRRAASNGYELRGDGTSQYLRTISRYPLIDGSREVELWSLISQGAAAQEELDTTGENGLTSNVRQSLQTRAAAGRCAHAELVCANLRLVVSIAKARHYEPSGVEFADRIQDGNLGLMRAADKFDGSKGFKFSTYATWWIKQAIDRGIGDRGRTIRIPVHLHEKIQTVRKAVARLTSRLGREPTLAEISEMTGLEPGKVQAALDLMHPIRSIDELLGEEGDLRLSDVLADHEEERDGRADPAEIVIHAMFLKDLTTMLTAVLPARAADIVERRFGFRTGDEETLDSIGADHGVTRERIRQIQDKSLVTLRRRGKAADLWSYLGR